jgi:4-azaleucine resistance transporter AzlC
MGGSISWDEADMDQAAASSRSLWRGEARAGLHDIAPAAIAAIPIGLLFGAVAAGKGMSVAEIGLMSALVFAGGAQFAAIETWIHPAPIAALAFATFLINVRHVLMGASLSPKVTMTRAQEFLAFFFMTDESWALSERRAIDRPVTGAYWMVMGVVLYTNWVVSTTLGAILGSFLGDPARLGADFAFTALFIGLIAGFGRNRVTLITVAVSAVVAALVYRFIGAPWHVACGAFAGIAAAYLSAPREARP